MHGNLAEQPQGPRLLTPPFAVAGVREHLLCQPLGLLHTASEEIGLSTGEGIEGHTRVSHHLPQHGKGVLRTASQGIGQRQTRGSKAVHLRDVRLLTQTTARSSNGSAWDRVPWRICRYPTRQ